MPLVKVVTKYHVRKEKGAKVRYAKGDTFQASDRELASFKGRLGRVETDADRAAATEAKTTATKAKTAKEGNKDGDKA